MNFFNIRGSVSFWSSIVFHVVNYISLSVIKQINNCKLNTFIAWRHAVPSNATIYLLCQRQNTLLFLLFLYILCKNEDCVLMRLNGHNGMDTVKLNTFIILGKGGIIIKKTWSVNSYNKSQRGALFLKFILVKNSTCLGQIYCPSSGVLMLYWQQ